MLHVIKIASGFIVVFLGSFALAVLSVPAILTVTEQITLSPLAYEHALRIYMVAIWLIMLVIVYWWISKKGNRRHRVTFWIYSFALVCLAYVFWADPDTRILEEQNWIRYVTGGALFLAALTSLVVAVQYARTWRERKALPLFWAIFTAAFAFAGLDELFEIHESIGKFIQARTSLGDVATDYVTVGYAIVALVVVIFLLRTFFREYRLRHQTFSSTLVMGSIAYIASTFFDTFDVYGERLIKKIGVFFSQDPRFVFSDLWYVIWAPHNLFNGIEEVLEYAAATAFFSAALIIFLEKQFSSFTQDGQVSSPSLLRKRFAVTLFGVTVIFSLISGAVFVRADSPLTNSSIAWSRIAGPQEKLRHSDDVFFHPAWGVLIGNEGRGTVELYDGKSISTLPDPGRLVHDPDSLTAATSSVYVSDGGAGEIITYTREKGYEVLYTREDGLKHPEAIVYHDGILYVLDESINTITKIDETGKLIEWRPSHPFWRAPEGIAYDTKTDMLLLTDDVSGAIFRARFEDTLDYLASVSKAEGITSLPDSSLLVTDNGWGSVMHIQQDGRVKSIAQFRRMYRDVQGIDTDRKDNTYVITADGFNSVSFMPSYLWRLQKIL